MVRIRVKTLSPLSLRHACIFGPRLSSLWYMTGTGRPATTESEPCRRRHGRRGRSTIRHHLHRDVIRAAWHEAGRYLHLCDNVGGAAGEQRDAIFNAMKATSRQPACSPASSPPFTGRPASTRRHLHCPRGCRQAVWRHLHPWRGGWRAARRHLQRHEDDVATAGA